MASDANHTAIAEQQRLLDEDPGRVEVYEELHRLYRAAQARDEAWCLQGALAYFHRADRSKQRALAHRPARNRMRARTGLNDEQWLMDLRHPDENLVVSKIFQQVWPAVLGLRGRPDRDAGLGDRYQVDPRADAGVFPRAFGFAADILGLRVPRLFVRNDVQGGVTHLPVYPLASLTGSSLRQGFSAEELLFIAGRHVSDYRGEHYVRTLVPALSELRTLLLACMRIAKLGPADADVDAFAREIRPKLQPSQIDVLAFLCRRLVQDHEQVDVQKWQEGVELTACRAGLLVCNDLEGAVRMIAALGGSGPFHLKPADKIQDLVRFSVSEPYFRLRAALGIESRVG